MKNGLFLTLFLIVIYCKTGWGQNAVENPRSFALKPQYGMILPHSGKVEHLTNTNPFGIELEYGRIMLKEKNWQQCNCYSKTGISFLYVNYDNPQVVGSSYNLIGFAEPFLVRTQRILLSARMGFGTSFLDKVYDEDNNPKNTFFSTTVNFIVHMDLNLYYKLNDKYSLMVFGKYNHISNGGVKQPNYGMNFPTFGIGINYYPAGELKFPEREKIKFNSEYFVHLYLFGMTKEVEADATHSEKNTYVMGTYALAGKTLSNVNGLSIGLEYLNDGAAKEEISRNNASETHQQVSGLIGHHLLFGKFDLSQYWGTYIYAPYWDKIFYQRYTLTYSFIGNIKGGLTMKVHGDVADSFHVLVGLSF